MTNEQKDKLTCLCKIEIKRWKEVSESNPNMRYMVELMEVALTALTAQPIKLPKKEKALIGRDYLYVYCAGPVESAIREAGYEVQE